LNGANRVSAQAKLQIRPKMTYNVMAEEKRKYERRMPIRFASWNYSIGLVAPPQNGLIRRSFAPIHLSYAARMIGGASTFLWVR
jgi:hypothetical protein